MGINWIVITETVVAVNAKAQDIVGYNIPLCNATAWNTGFQYEGNVCVFCGNVMIEACHWLTIKWGFMVSIYYYSSSTMTDIPIDLCPLLLPQNMLTHVHN